MQRQQAVYLLSNWRGCTCRLLS